MEVGLIQSIGSSAFKCAWVTNEFSDENKNCRKFNKYVQIIISDHNYWKFLVKDVNV